jgi:hypothetical protein
MNKLIWGLLGGLALAGCSGGDPVDIGNDEVTGEKLQDYAANWDGYIEGANFKGGWDRIRIRLDGSGGGVVHFGEGEPYVLQPGELPPPPFFDPFQERDNFETLGLRVDFEYPVSATVERKRLMLTLDAGQPYDEFCGSLHWDELGCIDYSAYVQPDSNCTLSSCAEWAVDCAAASAYNFCACNSNPCEAPPPMERWLDGSLSNNGRELEGTIWLGNVSDKSYVVRLQRVE